MKIIKKEKKRIKSSKLKIQYRKEYLDTQHYSDEAFLLFGPFSIYSEMNAGPMRTIIFKILIIHSHMSNNRANLCIFFDNYT